MLPIMQQEVDWIIDALARDPAKTRTGLAQALNIDKSGVSRLLKGDRRLKYEEAQRAAAYLGVTPGGGPSVAGLAEDGVEYTTPASGDDQATAPLFRAETGDDGFWRLDRGAVIERRPRLPQFSGAQDVFGFYAPDNAMAPRYHAGEVVWVNPARPAGAGMDTLLIRTRAERASEAIVLGVLKNHAHGALVLSQYGSGFRGEFDAAEWRAVHVYGRD